jgi:hypothetical protein
MSATRRWTCGGCGVTVSFPGNETAPRRPEGWAKRGKAWRCLRCRREEAMDEAAETADASDVKSVRRRALVEFELLRDPEAADIVVARRARCSSAIVAPVRAALRKEGKLPDPKG